MITYSIKSEQSLFDIAVEVYGDVTAVFWLLDDNPQLNGLTDRIKRGEVLRVRDASMNPRLVNYLADFGSIRTISEKDKPIGIDFWRAEEYKIG
ncbi:LysM peptidoglycan-binding domain-containing protein [Spirosoma aerolatum]|uniref:LysM peptidoglycan-binding domain-containing protein n=1 Tax=Spirosoma aerolatum TaxID=1211326 RepID=UPI0009ACCBCD|nr:LysM peptidoglycan-binding domain-containing protein [Spirosoma aerolatum]